MEGKIGRILDGHMHFWDLSERKNYPNADTDPSFGWPTREGETAIYRNFLCEDALKEFKVEETEVVFIQTLNSSPEEAEFIRDMALKSAPWIKGIVGGLNLKDSEGLKKTLKKLTAWNDGPKFVGIRHILDVEVDQLAFYQDASVLEGIKIVQDFGLTVDLLLRPHTLKFAAILAPKFPQLKFVIDHLAKPIMKPGETVKFEEWKKDLDAASKFTNVYVKLSGLVTEVDPGDYKRTPTAEILEPFVSYAFNAFGLDRCFYGSDWPVSKLTGFNHSDVVDILLKTLKLNPSVNLKDEDVINKLFYANCKKFYNL